MRTALIDADILLHKTSLVSQVSVDWDNTGSSEIYTEDFELAWTSIENQIHRLLEQTGSDRAVLCLSGMSHKNFRKQIYPPYKGTRSNEKPELFYPLREGLLKNYITAWRMNLEGDDVCGVLATNLDVIKGEKVICTIDKDLQQVPGLFFDWSKQTSVKEITEDFGRKFFYTQVLTGDPVDEYYGCHGVGPKLAEEYLDGCRTDKEYWEAVCECYFDQGFDAIGALVQARCAFILRHEYYNWKSQELTLWEPSLK